MIEVGHFAGQTRAGGVAHRVAFFEKVGHPLPKSYNLHWHIALRIPVPLQEPLNS